MRTSSKQSLLSRQTPISEASVRKLVRASSSSLEFMGALSAEVGLVASLAPPDGLTTERINAYMLHAMALAFLPLRLACAAATALIAILVAGACLPARICWSLLSPPGMKPRDHRASGCSNAWRT
jgi:hypothetical protein